MQAKQATVYGYDGNGYGAGDRVEIHPATDAWMRGARFGVVLGIKAGRVRVQLDKLPCRTFGSADDFKRVES